MNKPEVVTVAFGLYVVALVTGCERAAVNSNEAAGEQSPVHRLLLHELALAGRSRTPQIDITTGHIDFFDFPSHVAADVRYYAGVWRSLQTSHGSMRAVVAVQRDSVRTLRSPAQWWLAVGRWTPASEYEAIMGCTDLATAMEGRPPSILPVAFEDSSDPPDWMSPQESDRLRQRARPPSVSVPTDADRTWSVNLWLLLPVPTRAMLAGHYRCDLPSTPVDKMGPRLVLLDTLMSTIAP